MQQLHSPVRFDGEVARITIEDSSWQTYQDVIRLKQLPRYEVHGKEFVTTRTALSTIGITEAKQIISPVTPDFLFDRQKWGVNLALERESSAWFWEVGLGKTLLFLEFARQINELKLIPESQKVLIVSPLMVIPQTISEYNAWYPGEQPLFNAHGQIYKWLDSNSRFGIVNWQAFNNPVNFQGKVGVIIGDESSILKSRFGIIKQNFLQATRGIRWKMACTATPAPNDLEEYSNHAAYCGVVKNPQEFFSKYFTFDHKANTWRLRHHATDRFYQDMATWANYMRDPANYGFESAGIPEPTFTEVPVALTDEQEREYYARQNEGQMTFIPQSDGVKERSKASQISRGFIYESGKARMIPSLKPGVVCDLTEKHDTEQSIVWVEFIEEGKIIATELDRRGIQASHIYGEVPEEKRVEQVENFKAGLTQTLIANPSMLGFGLNFQNASVQTWSGITDSYEEFHQGVGRTVRYGATQPTSVYMPVTDLERAVFNNVLSKKNQFNDSMSTQERYFISNMKGQIN